MNNKQIGIIYILTNQAMPDYIKIGKTSNLKQRMNTLYNTSVPEPFELYYAAEVENYSYVEQQIHLAFSDKRKNTSREFFKINPDQVVAVLKLIEKSRVNIDHEYIEDEKELVQVQRRQQFNFDMIGLQPGDELEFTTDSSIKAVVHEDRKHIVINGEIKSLSASAQDIVGSEYPLQGTIFWTYEGKTLDEIRRGK